VCSQWLGWSAPDPNNEHFRSLVDACDALCARECIDPEQLHVWLDFHSINQENKHAQLLAINSLPFFAASMRYFVVLTPTALHGDTGLQCDTLTYQRRAWCRLECWARMAVGGLENMFISSRRGS